MACDALEAQPLLHGQQQFADAEQTDDRDQEADAGEQHVEAKGQAQAAGNRIHADGGEREAEPIETTVLNGEAPPSPMKLAKVRK